MQIRNVDTPIQVTGRHVSVTEAMKEYSRRRVASLHLDYPKIIEVQVILDVQKYRHQAEVILHCSNHITIEASAVCSDMYGSIDQAIDKVRRQMRRWKTRMMRNHRPPKQSTRELEKRAVRWEWLDPEVDMDRAQDEAATGTSRNAVLRVGLTPAGFTHLRHQARSRWR